MLSHSVSLLALATLATSLGPIERRDPIPLPPDTFTQITPSTNLTWQPCLSAFFCAVLDVPLDYSLPNGTRAFIPLIKYPATVKPYKGMVLTNPGGPGESGIEFLANNSLSLAPIVGPNYDFVAWEPRGLGYSVPATNCTGALSSIPGVQKRSSNSSDKLHGPNLQSQFFEDALRSSNEIGEACEAVTGDLNDAGPHMTTLVVAKDMISILDAYAASDEAEGVEDASILNYWGFSYGTFIGQTFATLYPDRVGRVVLDGVVDGDDYSSGAAITNVIGADEALSTFFIYCHLAGPTQCPYYTGNTPHDIFLRFEETLLRLDTTTAFQNNWPNATEISLGLEAIKVLGRVHAYFPIDNFPEFAELAVAFEVMSQNITMDKIQQVASLPGGNFNLNNPRSAEWGRAVFCTDNGGVLYNQTLDDIADNLKIQESQSYIGGEYWETDRIACLGWSIKGKERFAGPFGGCTKNPILFVSNTRDPITPLSNGQRANGLFNESQLLIVDATGHTTLAAQSECASLKINAFFQNGTLPGDDNSCALEAGPWNVTLSSMEERRDWRSVQFKKV